MRVGLFTACYVDQLYPDVGMATVELLERVGCEMDFPPQQTCCGQPMANTGCFEDARPLAEAFLRIFSPYASVVCPSSGTFVRLFGPIPLCKSISVAASGAISVTMNGSE